MLIDERLSETFDLTPLQGTLISNNKIIPSKENPIENDYEHARINLYTLLNQGEDALFAALNVAKQSENARAFEVVGNLIKQLADINHQLVELHSKHKEVCAKKDESPNNVTNNNIFCGTTNDLMKIIRNINSNTIENEV